MIKILLQIITKILFFFKEIKYFSFSFLKILFKIVEDKIINNCNYYYINMLLQNTIAINVMTQESHIVSGPKHHYYKHLILQIYLTMPPGFDGLTLQHTRARSL